VQSIQPFPLETVRESLSNLDVQENAAKEVKGYGRQRLQGSLSRDGSCCFLGFGFVFLIFLLCPWCGLDALQMELVFCWIKKEGLILKGTGNEHSVIASLLWFGWADFDAG